MSAIPRGGRRAARSETADVKLRRRGRNRPGTLRAASSGDVDHLREFIRSRHGVEAYLEPRTTVTDTTVVLVAADGEWTRRRVSDPDAAQTSGQEACDSAV